MSQPNHKFDYDYAPKRETGGGLSSVPGAGMSGDADPTVEIRHLISQLQGSARDSRERVAVVERERDQLRDQLDDLRAEMLAVKTREEESRAKFVEVTAVIRERDQLLASLDQHHKSIAELQRRLDTAQRQELDLQRQRGALILERDTAVREHDSASREREELRNRLAEMQRQVVAIRQARDTAQAHCQEHIHTISERDDEISELTHDLEAARKSGGAVGEWKIKCEEITAERDRLATDLEVQRSRVLDLLDKEAQSAAVSAEKDAALKKAQDECSALSQERDELRQKGELLGRDLEALRTELTRLREEATAVAKDAANPAEVERLTAALAELTTERDALKVQAADASAALAAKEAAAAEQLAAAQKSRDEAFTSLTAAQKQIEHIIRDRDQVRQQSVDHTLSLEAELNSAREQIAKFDVTLAEIEARMEATQREADRVQEKARNFEGQRLQSIDLAAQLDASKREVRRLTADLAEARLEAKAAGGRPLRPRPAAAASAAQPLDLPTANHPQPDEPLDEREGRAMLVEMKRCYAAFAKTPTDFSLLNELSCQVAHYAERARVSGFMAMYRLANGFDQLVQSLYKFPEHVNPSSMRTIGQTLELLGTMLKQKDLAGIKDPAQAQVFAVDDDWECCEAIRMAMEIVGMRTHSAQEPSVALAELATKRCDLILLDVALPDMDGFELCEHIRSLSAQARTPIVFLTGLATMENRVQSSLSGGNDFVAKPFNLHELGVKAISLVLRNSMHLE